LGGILWQNLRTGNLGIDKMKNLDIITNGNYIDGSEEENEKKT
jgi:hypothetical protein